MTEQELQHEIARLKKWNKWFFYRVKFMRQSQKEYFRLRNLLRKNNVSPEEREAVEDQSKEWLKKSKALESEVDAELMRLSNIVSYTEARKELELTFGELEEVNLQNSEHAKVTVLDDDKWSPEKNKGKVKNNSY